MTTYFSLPIATFGLEANMWNQSGEGPVPIYQKTPIGRTKAVALLVCNAYGVLSYAEALADSLLKNGIAVHAENGRGQGGREGQLTIANATEDFTEAYKRAAYNAASLDAPLVGILHCSGTYAVASAIERGANLNAFRAIIIYSYLHRISSLWPKTRKKLDHLHVNYDPHLISNLPHQEVISAIGCEKYIVHPTTMRSLARASQKEVNAFSARINARATFFPSQGYTFDDSPQYDQTQYIAENYYCPIILNEREDITGALDAPPA